MRLVLSPLVIKQARRNLAEAFPRYLEPFESWLQGVPFERVDDPTAAAILGNEDMVRDLKDVPIALSAIHAGVYCLVSGDNDFSAEDATTAELHKRLKVTRPVVFLRDVLGWSREDLEQVRSRDWPPEEPKG